MELTLNLIWVCVAIVGVLVQIVMLSRARAGAPARRPGSNWQKIVAMGCALVILFFVISMTDDLHDQTLVFEETKLSRITPGAKTSPHSASDRSVPLDFLLFFLIVPFTPPSPSMSRLGRSSQFLFVDAIECESLCNRAPPVTPA
jgi:hypothetical protein